MAIARKAPTTKVALKKTGVGEAQVLRGSATAKSKAGATLAPATKRAATGINGAAHPGVAHANGTHVNVAAIVAPRPAYWDRACADLMRRDRILKKLIPCFGPAHLENRTDAFVTLARSIVGQQISARAAQGLWERVVVACPKLAPAQFVKLGFDKLSKCGLSKRKAEYILDLAEHFESGALHVDTWASMEDEAVIAELTQIRGIGRWTAEMFLIFNLGRPDIVPLDDLGLIRAISVNYFSGEPVTRSEAREVAANWEPWRTVATWYMWRSLEPLPAAD